MTTYIVIGNGIAANTAAENIRKIDQSGKISMFSSEKYYFYYTPALPHYLSGEKTIQDITIHDKNWYQNSTIDLHLETEITSVDGNKKEIIAKNGKKYSYDKLLLAAGSNSFVPPIKGVPTDGVFTLRTVDNANRIKEQARRSKKMVLIGGGLLGLEAGNGLRKTGIEVAVVEFYPRLLPRQMDSAGAAMLQKQMEEMGFIFYLGAKTQEIIKENGKLKVCLEGGEKIVADMVLISAGVRPETTIAKSLGLEIDKGIKVNDTMKTSLDDIYAAGDLIEHKGRVYGIWPASMEQGRIAGCAMAGKPEAYKGTILSNTLKVVGIDLVSAGEIDADGTMESVIRVDEKEKVYRKIVLKDNVIIGTILYGNIGGSEEIQQAIKTKKNVASFKKDLAGESFDFNLLK